MKRNLLTITMLALCLVISIALVAVPTSAQDFYCMGTEEVSIIDEPYIEMTMQCEGEAYWGMYIEGLYIGDLGEVELLYWIGGETEYGIGVEEGQIVLSNGLLKRKVDTELLTGDKLAVEFKFKPPMP